MFVAYYLLLFCGAYVAVLWVSYRSHRAKALGQVRDLFARADKDPGQVVTEEMLAGLPEPVQRYLAAAGVVGKPLVKTVRLKQVGKIQPNPKKKWMDLTAEEYYSVEPPSFIWMATVRTMGLPVVAAFDSFQAGAGNMVIDMFSAFKRSDVRGTEIDQGSMLRLLQEMTWFPSAYLSQNITWKTVDDHSADVTLSDHGKSVTGRMFFDDQDRMTDFVADRYRALERGFELSPWSTPMSEYGEYQGLKLPKRGRGVWKLAAGDQPYIEVEATEIEYDKPEAYA